MDRFIVGSNAFFSCYEDFVPHDMDILLIDDNPDYKISQQIRLRGNCYFRWKRMSAEEFINAHKDCKCGLFIGKFLVPEFANEIGLTIDNLKELSFLLDYLDTKHLYEKVIYDAYIENNGFYLTQSQRDEAYNIYKKYKDEKR